MLTLASNERIPLKPYMRMLFEIRDLRFATPATVSRAGIIYISGENGNIWHSIIASWVQMRPDEVYSTQSKAVSVLRKSLNVDKCSSQVITDLFQKYVPSTLKYLRVHAKAVVPIEDMALISGFLAMLEGVVAFDVANDKFKLETAFVFCAIWAFGSALTLSDDGSDNRKNFSNWWKNQFKQVRLPTRDTVFDYWLEPTSNKFEPWRQSPSFKTVDYDSRTTIDTDQLRPSALTIVQYNPCSLVEQGREDQVLKAFQDCSVVSCTGTQYAQKPGQKPLEQPPYEDKE